MDQLYVMGVVALASVGAALAQMKAIARERGASPPTMSGAKRSMVSLRRMSSGIVFISFFLVTSAKANDSIPGPTRTIIASSSSQLLSALKNAQPGDHIVLTNGRYSGFTVSRSGQNGRPIVIRAANKLSARISGTSVTVSGDYVWLVGLDFTEGARVIVEGTGDRVTSSRLKVKGSAILLKATAFSGHSLNAEIDHNEIISMAAPTSVGWNAIRVDVAHDDLGHKIYRNYIHGAPQWTGKDGGNCALQLGYSNHRERMARVLFELNLIENWRGSNNTLSVKTSGNTIRLSTVVRGSAFTNREGHDNAWTSNWLESSKQILVRDRDNTIVRNRAPVDLMVGDFDSDIVANFGDPARAGKSFPQAKRVLVAGNTGQLRVGYGLDALRTHRVLNTQIEAHRGTVELRHQAGTTQLPTTAQTYPAAFKLTPADVGPFAPTAPQIDASV
jgi:poly(beta-D-mannuronate) lyase